MVFLTVCRNIADSTALLWLFFLFLLPVFGFHSYIAAPLEAYDDGLNLPDARFGYTPDELNLWYDRIGVEGCRMYKLAADWDMYAIMIIYPLFLGSMLVKSARIAGMSERMAYLPLVTVACDVVETYFQREGCILYPERLTDGQIILASYANRLKWAGLVLSMTLIVALFVPATLSSRPSQKEGEAKTE